MRASAFQKYPRDEHDKLDAAELKQHTRTLDAQELKSIVKRAIEDANKKSSHVLLNIPESASEAEVAKEYKKSGEKLYDYFKKRCNDPIATAHRCHERHYTEIAYETLEIFLGEQEAATITLRNKAIDKALTRHSASPQCGEIATAVLNELMRLRSTKTEVVLMPEELANAFGTYCRKDGLLNDKGIFEDPYKTARVLCGIEE